MQIKGLQPPATSPHPLSSTSGATLSAVATAAMVRGWRAGQILSAMTLPDPQTGQALLKIDGRLLQAHSGRPLSPGQQLQLEVTQPGTDALLRLLSPAPRPGRAAPTITLPPPALSSAGWQAGQIIQALIIGPAQDTRDKAAQRPTLVQIGGSILPLPLPPAAAGTLRPGQGLRLEIVDPGLPAALRVLKVSTAAFSPEQALRGALPHQVPLGAVLANLTAIASAGPRRADLPEDVLQQVRQLLDQLPQREAIGRGDGLQQALARSGIYFEARLAEALRTDLPFVQTARLLGGDLKGGLLALLATLLGLRIQPAGTGEAARPAAGGGRAADTPPPLPNGQPAVQPRQAANITPQLNTAQVLQELLRQVEGGLARIQLSQLASGTVEDDGRRAWLLDLPLRHGAQIDVLQLRIEEERSGGKKGTGSLWSVNLAFELEGLGAIHARVTLAGGTVSATFWAEKQRTAGLFERHMGELQQRLQAAGLEVGALTTRHGAPQQADSRPALPYVLLDVEA